MIVKVKRRENPFVMIDKRPLEDDRLSWRAKGILAYLLCKPDNWEVSIKDIWSHGKEGRNAVQDAMQELQAHGYAALETARDEKGRVVGKRWTIYEMPEDQERTDQQTDSRFIGDRNPDSRFIGSINKTEELTNKENNIEVEEEKPSPNFDSALESLKASWASQLAQDNAILESASRVHKLAAADVQTLIAAFIESKRFEPTRWSGYTDFRKNFWNWIPYNIKNYLHATQNVHRAGKAGVARKPATIEERASRL